MHKKLNPILHNELRLSIMSILMQLHNAEFGYLLEETGATKGNLSTQIKNLEKNKYIKVEKTYKNNYPLTLLEISAKGRKAFEEYFEALKSFYPSK